MYYNSVLIHIENIEVISYMNIKEIVHMVNENTDEHILELIQKGKLSEERLLECADKFSNKIQRIISKNKSSTNLYDGQLWVAKEDCMNAFHKGQIVDISNVDIENDIVVIDGAVATSLDILVKYFNPK